MGRLVVSSDDLDSLDFILGSVVSSCENGHNLKHPRKLWQNFIREDLSLRVRKHSSNIPKEDIVINVYNWLEELLNKPGKYDTRKTKNVAEEFVSNLIRYSL